MATMMKQRTVAVAALMLALVLLAPGGASATECDATKLAVCLPAIETGATPTPECCAILKKQKGCLCLYAKDPRYAHYLKSPHANKTLQACGVPVPKC
ncbi:unnamed protein product [Alopecurus aequalis]